MATGRKQASLPTGDSSGAKNERTQSRLSKEKKSNMKEHSDRRDSNSSVGTRSRTSFFVATCSSDLKWQRSKMVVGALEVKSDPLFLPKEDMTPLYKKDEGRSKSKFEDALQTWEDLKLRRSFIKACADLPESSCCCGLTKNDNTSTIKQYVTLLNDGWVKHVNNKLKPRGFKIDTFLWNWENAAGKSMSILLIRFFELSTYKFRRASEEGSLDLDDMLLDKEQKKAASLDNSSHYAPSENSQDGVAS